MIKGLKATLFAGIFAIGASAFAAAPVVTLPGSVIVTDEATAGEFVNSSVSLSGASSETGVTWAFTATGTPQYTVNNAASGALVEGGLTIKNKVLSASGDNQPFPASESDTLRTLTFTATNGDGAGSADVDVITQNPNASASFAFSVQAATPTVGSTAKLIAKVTNNSGAAFTTNSLVSFSVNPADGAFFSGFTVNSVAGTGYHAVNVPVGPLANGASATVEQSIVLAKAGAINVSGSAIVEGSNESDSEVINVTDDASGVNYKGTAAVAVKNGVKFNAKKNTTSVKIDLLTNAEAPAPVDLPAKGLKWKFTADAYLLPEGVSFSSPAQLTASALKKPITLASIKAKKFTTPAKKSISLKNVPGNLSGRTVVIKLYTFDKKLGTTDHLAETNIHDNYIVVTIP